MADTKKKATGTRKKTGTSYKSSTKRYKNTTLYRTTATNRKRYSTGTRESTMTVHYRSVPNNPKKPKTATKKTPAKASTAKKTASTAKKTATKTAVKPQAKPTATASKPSASTAKRPMLNRRPMTDDEYEYYKLGYGAPSKIKYTKEGKIPRGRSDTEYDAYILGRNRKMGEELSARDRVRASESTLAGKKIGAPVYNTEKRYAVKASFLSRVDEKLPGSEIVTVRNRAIYAITRETEKAALCAVEAIAANGDDHRREVWIPKSCIEVH